MAYLSGSTDYSGMLAVEPIT